MLIITTPGGWSATTPLERGNNGVNPVNCQPSTFKPFLGAPAAEASFLQINFLGGYPRGGVGALGKRYNN